MAEKAICPICEKRRAERYCPAKGEKICAIDCGTEREVTIDCPSDCAYLLAAHRWEQDHPKPLAENELPFPDVSFPSDLIHTRQAVLSGIGYTVLIYAASSLPSPTRMSSPPCRPWRKPAARFFPEFTTKNRLRFRSRRVSTPRLRNSSRTKRSMRRNIRSFPPLKDTEIFHLLVFFLRFGRLRSNGRPRTRGFIEFLRSQFPARWRREGRTAHHHAVA